MQSLAQSSNLHKSAEECVLSFPGVVAAIIFSCGPFMYATIFNHGLFLYLAILFIFSVFIQAFFLDKNHSLRLKPSLGLQPLFFMFCVCLFWQLLSFLWSSSLSVSNIYSYIKVMLFFLLLSIPRYTERDKRLMLIMQTVIICIANYMMLIQAETIMQAGSERLTFSFFGVPQDPNYLAFFYVTPMVVLFSMMIATKRPFFLRLFSAFLILFLLYGLLRTGSRGALAGISLALIVYFICHKKTAWWKAVLFVLIGLLFILVLLTQGLSLLPKSVAERFSLNSIISTGGAGRTDIWLKYLIAIFSNRFILIFGAGNSSGQPNLNMSAHNYIIESWYEYGLIGIALLSIFFFILIRATLKKKNNLSFSIIVGALSIAAFLSVGRMLPFWLCLTLATVLSLPTKAEDKKSYYPPNKF